ncbi:MAG: chemotaxis response regulator protein-glutamate methylesterase [Planctomycetota bacterium]|nr:chemotaxis response regulator protein-glutamate methylesterase [Planctomycetota bacterium]
MSRGNIRVLVVDDSVVIRSMICDSIAAASGMEVVGTAADGEKAVEAFKRLKPDVVSLDIQMPKLDGLETLDAMLAIQPVPVIMVSSLTQLGGSTTFDALDRGAIDYVAKPECGAEAAKVLGGDLIQKLRNAAGTDVSRILRIRKERKERRAQQQRRKEVEQAAPKQQPAAIHSTHLADKCIAIGISTGGPPALSTLFESLRPPMPPIIIVQHMPAQFTKPLAWRLNSLAQLTIKEAASGDILRPNHVLIAPGGKHLQVRRQGSMAKVLIRDGEPVSSHKPSVDVMMKSVAEVFSGRCLGVIMTGMGRDGADGCGNIKAAGGYTLGQDETSSDVYGMNKVAYVEGHVDRQFSLDRAAAVISQQVARLWEKKAVGCGTG